MPKKKHVQLAPEPPCTCPACLPNPLGNARDFLAEGELRIVRTHGGAPVFLLDNVCLGELARFHFKPEETCAGYQFGRVQVLIMPVRE